VFVQVEFFGFIHGLRAPAMMSSAAGSIVACSPVSRRRAR
jgi:hypothetical protein